MSWHLNLQRVSPGKGFWQDAFWYEANVELKMPLLPEMIRQLIQSLPSLKAGDIVCDLLAGTGKLTCPLIQAYPEANYIAIDKCSTRLQICKAKIDQGNHLVVPKISYIEKTLLLDDSEIVESCSFDLIVGTLALHVLIGHEICTDSSLAEQRYLQLFSLLFRNLKPGGHLIFGDHVGLLRCFRQLKLMEEIGFVDVDVAWFVAGGRKP